MTMVMQKKFFSKSIRNAFFKGFQKGENSYFFSTNQSHLQEALHLVVDVPQPLDKNKIYQKYGNTVLERGPDMENTTSKGDEANFK